MENYIVRIYRRDQKDPDKVHGLLESVERETQQPFQTITALQSLLTSFATNLSPESARHYAKDKCDLPRISRTK